MSTRSSVTKDYKVTICSNCEHFIDDDRRYGCSLQKWGKNHFDEHFFYNPFQFYQEFKDYDNFYMRIWNNGIACNSYKGGIWLVTEVNYNREQDEVLSMNGQSQRINVADVWTITIMEVGVQRSSNRTYTLRMMPDDKNNITQWFHNLVL